MARRVRRSFRRSSRKTGRRYRKRYSTRMPSIRIKRSVALAPVIASGVAGDNTIRNDTTRNVGYFQFSLSDLPNNGEITALYSLYKLTGVSLKLIPISGTQADAGSVSSTFLEPFAYTVDKSIRPVPTDMDDLLEAGNCRIVTGAMRPIKIWVPYPKAGITTGGQSAMMTTPWLDSDQNAIKHWGVRYAFASANTTATVRYKVYATYYLRVKTLK